MKNMDAKDPVEAELFYRFLKEEGIGEIYRTQETPKPQANPAPAAATGAKNDLLMLRDTVLKCAKCAELAATRKSVVFGSGNVTAALMFVGEAPGYEEDVQGLPFVGPAGQLLTKIIESIGLERKQVFIANVLKCRPPQNRTPQPEEILNCEPYLREQIERITPRVLCAFGTFAAQTLHKTGENISSMRGRFYDYHGAKLLCTYHPAYLLRNPGEKRKVWEDMKKIRQELGEAV
ncbi:MAG: uracil-DNA glycosylase [Candidatus Omnitrophota bacterium]|jgi:DNA polymerase